jgi:hypothetical protein
MPGRTGDDVIRIRIDTASAVLDFLALIARQAAEGETRAPANPANRAVFRELAPFRLVEYEYVDKGVGAVEGVYLGFPDGAVYTVGEILPEEAVDALVAGDPKALPPIYIYVVLAAPAAPEAVDAFLVSLADHVGQPLVAAVGEGKGAIFGAGLLSARERKILEATAAKCAAESGRHLGKADLLSHHAARGPGAKAYVQLTYGYVRYFLEFDDAAGRDDFIAWTSRLWEFSTGFGAVFGLGDVSRPAEPCPAPPAGANLIHVPSPKEAADSPWAAFDVTDSARALALAQAYWQSVVEAVTTGAPVRKD